ncbi:leader peptidase (prepilin peptidase)/N-methyltransferase/prepilin peptidase CpaA [Kroppenstedtia sanguinis]|uniref:prepilin peptidase n=1 Tax=Kroppenstedtia sanguinis TaxID=1380684 RepID=UPI003D1C7BEA
MNLPATEHLIYISLILVLICATITDLRERLIYDRFVLVGVAFSLGVHLYGHQHSWMEYILTGLGAFLVLAVIAIMTKGGAIGGGDIKLFTMIGFAAGLEGFLSIFILSHVLAAMWIVGKMLFSSQSLTRKSELPFAPFVLTGTVGTYLFMVM